jgi:hypothetical protein
MIDGVNGRKKTSDSSRRPNQARVLGDVKDFRHRFFRMHRRRLQPERSITLVMI